MQKLSKTTLINRGGFGDEAASVGEVDVGLGADAGEVVEGGVVVAGEAVTGPSAVGIDEGCDGVALADAFQITTDAGRGIVGQGIGAGKEEDFEIAARERPESGVLGDEVEPAAEIAQVIEEVLADVGEDFPEGLAGLEETGLSETAEESDVDGGGEAAEGIAADTEPLGGGVGAAGIEPLGGLQPIAELAGVFIDAEMLEHEAEGADGRVIGGELMVIEVMPLRGMLTAYIDDSDSGIGQIGFGRLASLNGHSVDGGQETTGKKFVFVTATGVREDASEGNGHEERGSKAEMRAWES